MDFGSTAAVNDLLEDTSPVRELVLGFRFAVFVFTKGAKPNLLDIRFQKVSGLSAEIKTEPENEGGQNLNTHRKVEAVVYGNLVLQRGMVVGSPLSLEFESAMSQIKVAPSEVLVTLLGDDKQPVAAWKFSNAYPVKWSVSDLDASQKEIVIETLELAYSRMERMRI